MTQAGVISRRRLYQQVAEDIERQILNGSYPLESRLPSEQELAGRYGVSRNVIREALKSLKELGLVSIRNGSGTFVSRPTTGPVSEALHRFLRHSPNGISLEQLYEVRRLVEPDCARLAAERATPEDLQAIEAALRTLEQNPDDPRLTSQADLDFHLAIAAATHNPLISAIVNPIIGPLYITISASHAYPKLIQLSLEGHKPIWAGIQGRDPERAWAAMQEHLTVGVREDLRLQIRVSE